MILTAPSALRWRISYASGFGEGQPMGSELVKAHRDRRPGCGKRILSWPCRGAGHEAASGGVYGSRVAGNKDFLKSPQPTAAHKRAILQHFVVVFESGRMSGGEVISPRICRAAKRPATRR
jgi:hypothetical protein